MQRRSIASGAAQQYCGHAWTTVPSFSVSCRIKPDAEPSRARLASTVTLLPLEASNAGLSTLRLRKKPGGGPSNDQRSTCAGVVDVDEHVDVRVAPVELGKSARSRDHLVEVEHGRHVVVSPGGAGSEQNESEDSG